MHEVVIPKLLGNKLYIQILYQPAAQALFIEEAESIICSESAYLRNCHGRFAIASKPQEHCRHGTFRHQHQEYLRNIRSRSKSNGQRNWKESLTGWKTVGIRSSRSANSRQHDRRSRSSHRTTDG